MNQPTCQMTCEEIRETFIALSLLAERAETLIEAAIELSEPQNGLPFGLMQESLHVLSELSREASENEFRILKELRLPHDPEG
ncbi:hypothetical protein [Nitrosomonas communis]|uniref:hypothetical protein n=1 Tax=Nitrosomonas communis TaxID=44574 RepID=UPI0026EB24F0|nr:hypothetical protein [Nitrosomonas communis]MCO6427119.1 hypothetical protein [Nitrosomonas communis]